MLENRKSRLATAASVFAVSVAFAAPAQAQNEAGSSLVNVQLSDTTVLVPVSVAANLCDINANVLAGQVRNGDTECVATPTATAPADSAGGNSAGDSLVNVQADDTTIAVPIAVAANICDVNINALLATQLRTGTPTCTATSDSSTS